MNLIESYGLRTKPKCVKKDNLQAAPSHLETKKITHI